MKDPTYRLHKATGQAVATFNGRDVYLGKHGSKESQAYFGQLLAEFKKCGSVTVISKKVKDDGPSYRLHKASGQAMVCLGGRDYYLGEYGSARSKAEFHRLKAEYHQSGCSSSFGAPPDELTVAQLIAGYIKYSKAQFGTGPESEYLRAKPVLTILMRLYGHTNAVDFGPLQFEVVQAEQTKPTVTKRKDGTRTVRYRSRRYINAQMKRLRAVIKWATSKALIPPTVLVAIQTVPPLKYGRTDAPELPDVVSVSDEIVEQTLPHLNHVVRAMVAFQKLTGARPGEICVIKPRMVDKSLKDTWLIIYDRHKTAYRGKKRSISIGPKAIEILRPFLLRGEDDYCFSPREAVKRLRELKHEARTTPLSCGNSPGTNAKKRPGKSPGECYSTQSYGRSIRGSCVKAGIEPWAPNQLRHAFATQITRNMSIEHASQAMGHADTRITKTYLDEDRAKANEAARMHG